MKTNNMFKVGFFAAAFALLSMTVSAQTPNYTEFTTTGTESIDTVTVGSRMPYKMAGDPVIVGLAAQNKMKSEFKWAFYTGYLSTVTGTPLAWAINKGTTLTSATASTDAAYPNYYTDKEINVVMPGSPGQYSLVVNERSIILPSNVAGCTGTDSIARIQVVAKPTLQWPTVKETAGCAATAVTIPLTMTGYGKWIVSYTVKYTKLDGTGATTLGTYTAVEVGTDGRKSGQYDIVIPAANLDNLQTDKSGIYTITINTLTDRISRKSLDQTSVAAVVGTHIPAAADVYTVNVYPAPKTKKLEHVKNMP